LSFGVKEMLNWTAVTALLMSQAGGLSGEETVFDVPALCATPLRAKILARHQRDGIVTEEVRYHSENDRGKDVEIFAYFSYAQGARNLPAFIWNPGGLGQANPQFTVPGARRGYAVLCIDFPQPGYRSTGGYPINAGLDLGRDPRQAPIYHGAVALLKAVSYLETRPEVDKNRIGMAGASWGGFFTTLMIGVDPRLKVGSCLYGTGNLQIGNAWWDGDSRRGPDSPGPAERERWRKTLDPAWRLRTAKTPIAWFTGTNDRFYLLPSVMQTYAMAAGPKHLTLFPNWDHALPSKIHDEEVFAWLDVYLQSRRPFVSLSPVAVENKGGHLAARWDFQGEAAAADLIASYGDDGNWRGRYWHTFPAQIDGHACRAELPDATLPCEVSGAVIDKQGFRYSTPLLRVDPIGLGIKASQAVPDYDGCAEWGSFEKSQIAYLWRHDRSGQKRWVPRVSRDVKEGEQSAVLELETTVLPPILSTATIPHRFTCFLKAARPTDVTVQVSDVRRRVHVDRRWTEVSIEVTPPQELMGGVPASITIPRGATVLVDAVAFHPMGARRTSQNARRGPVPSLSREP
jgi:dienelactone hydrolase